MLGPVGAVFHTGPLLPFRILGTKAELRPGSRSNIADPPRGGGPKSLRPSGRLGMSRPCASASRRPLSDGRRSTGSRGGASKERGGRTHSIAGELVSIVGRLGIGIGPLDVPAGEPMGVASLPVRFGSRIARRARDGMENERSSRSFQPPGTGAGRSIMMCGPFGVGPGSPGDLSTLGREMESGAHGLTGGESSGGATGGTPVVPLVATCV